MARISDGSTRAMAKTRLNQYEGSIEDLDKAIKINNGSAEFYYGRGCVYEWWGKTTEAENDYQKALQLARQANDTNFIPHIEEALRDLNKPTTN